MKTCTKCDEAKPLDEFYVQQRSHGPYRVSYCKTCACVWARATSARRSKDSAYMAKEAAKKRDLGKELRVEMVQAYGGACHCCGEDGHLFLTLDHIECSGNHVRSGSGGHRGPGGIHLYNRLKKQGWPTDNLRLACWNCNCGRQYNAGICPHDEVIEPVRYWDKWRRVLKAETLDVYGGSRCSCCGESNLMLLTLDHLEGVGEKNRTSNVYSWLRARGWPDKDKLRVLCYNCNSGRHLNGGECPHVMQSGSGPALNR